MSPLNNAAPPPEATVAIPVAAVADTSSGPQKSGTDALSVGALLAAAPGLGFILSWVHEWAYVQRFGVPPNLIAPQLSDVLVATGLLLLLTLAAYLLAEVYVSLRAPGKEFGIIESKLVILSVVTLLIVASELTAESLVWRIVFLGIWVLAVVQLFVPITRGRGTYRERLVAQERAIGRRSLTSALRDRFGRGYLFIVLTATAALFLSMTSGGLEAAQQTTYFVTTGGPSQLVVRIYGDTVILADYDTATHQIRRRYHVQKLGNQPLNMEERRLGHLSLGRS